MKKDVAFRSVYYSDVFDGVPPSNDLLHEILRHYSLGSVLAALAEVSFVRGAANLAAEWEPRSPFGAHWYGLYSHSGCAKENRDDAPQLVGRPVLLFIAREALRVCPDSGEAFAGNALEKDFGRLIFIAADLLFPKTTGVEEGLASNAAQNQFVGTGIKQRVVRSLKMTELLSQTFERRSGVPANTKFEETVGLSISDFQNVRLSVFLRFMMAAEQLVQKSTDHIDLDSLAGCVVASPRSESGISPLKMQRFFDAVSLVTPAGRQRAGSCSNPFDFTLFRERPLLKLGSDDPILIDPGFLLDKIDKGLFFALANAGDKKQTDAVFSLWGGAFENFTGWLLTEHIGHPGIHINPRFKKNDNEICDLAICSSATAVLIECKGCYFSGGA